ncbi:unknown protein [Seminavis robusta]|uniref:Uncharacterized protein n=1 Tax=Seminavis robusta TaxID=568900 RepID=A0A9N8ELA1_9STRA|nr:unknown protein [Seminavis robusta]|eukprot:Sro1465_g274990.1 n/a (1192) ;mRNA; r:12984-16559
MMLNSIPHASLNRMAGPVARPLAGQPLPLRPVETNIANTKKRAPFKRKTRNNLEWQKDLLEIYSALWNSHATAQTEEDKLTLHGFCHQSENMTSQYKRIHHVWKQLGLEDFLSRKVEPSSSELMDKINGMYPVNDDNSSEQQRSGRNRSNKKNEMRSDQEWQTLLFSLYHYLSSAKALGQKESVRSYCIKVLKDERQYRRIQDVWRSLQLEADLEANVLPESNELRAKLASRYPATTKKKASASVAENSTTARDLRPSSNSYFDHAEEATMCEGVGAFAKAGFPLEKANLKQWADAFLEADGIARGTNSIGGISMDTVERLYKQGRLKAKANVNPIDPKRAAQAESSVLNAFYHQVDAHIKLAHEIDPDVWPENRYANVPPTRIYNTDEQGPNPTHLRNPVLIPEEMLERPRLFQNTREGDGKMQFHYSVANVVRADGVQCHPHECVEGAPAPFVLISDASSSHAMDSMDKADRDRLLANQTEADVIPLNDAVLRGWFNDYQVGKKDTIVNKFGFQVRTTPTGSMLKRTFYDFLLHFSSQLPQNQGKNGLGVILFLDWHCSRECPQSLITAFFRLNILLFVLPSKTSIWSQPCDNGKNELTAKDIAMEAHKQGLFVGKTLDYLDANSIFRAGLEKNCIDQNDELRRTGSNAVASSFKKTGLYPMDYQNEGWQLAIQNFHGLNKMLKEQRRESGEPIPDIIWVTKAKPINDRECLSDEEEATIKVFLPSDDFMNGGDDTDPIEVPTLFLAFAIADQLLGKHVLDPKRDLSRPPKPTDDLEKAALKLVHYVAVTDDNHVDTTCTRSADAIARDKLETKLSVLMFGHSIMLRKRDDNSLVNLTKQSASKFMEFDNDRRASRNFTPSSFAQVLDQYYDGADDTAYALTKKDKRKGQKRARVARKKLNSSMYAEATEVADGLHLTRNLEAIIQRLRTKHPHFASQLVHLLEDEDMGMADLYDDFEAVVLDPFTTVVPVSREGVTKEISVTRVGTDVSAVGYRMETTLMKMMIDMKAKTGGAAKRRKRNRRPGTATHLGKSGVVAGILLQRQSKEEELKALEKTEKSAIDELDKLKTLHQKAVDLKTQLSDGFWKWDVVKGWRRVALARLFGVFKSGDKADAVASSLKALNLTKEKVLAKMAELEREIKSKEQTISPIVAQRREREDFMAETADYAVAPSNTCETQNDESDDDDEDD